MTTRNLLLPLFLVSSAALAQVDDVTGFGSATKPRVMVILDNSRSMEESPAGALGPGSVDDFTPPQAAALAPGQKCDPATLANCRNKFCQAKCVMHNILDPHEGLFDVSFATYYQYYMRAQVEVGSARTARTTCTYDVLAKPDQVVNNARYRTVWSKENNLNMPGRCLITLNSPTNKAFTNTRAGPQGTMSMPTRWEFNCVDSAAGNEVAKNCTKNTPLEGIASNDFPGFNGDEHTGTFNNDAYDAADSNNSNFFQFDRFSLLAGPGTAGPNPTTPTRMTATPVPYQHRECSGRNNDDNIGNPPENCLVNATGSTPSTFTASAAFGWLPPDNRDGHNYNLFEVATYPSPTGPGMYNRRLLNNRLQDIPGAPASCPANYRATGSFAGITSRSYAAGNGREVCTGQTPCDFSLLEQYSNNYNETYWYDRGASYAGGAGVCTRNLIGATGWQDATDLPVSPTSPVPGCSAPYSLTSGGGNCSAANPCPSRDSQTVSANATGYFANEDLGATFSSGGFTYQRGSTTGGSNFSLPEQETNSCPATAPCGASSGSLSGGCTGNRIGTDTRTETEFVGGEPLPVTKTYYTCNYTRVRVNYTRIQFQCQRRYDTHVYTCGEVRCAWQLNRYRWRSTPDRYDWLTTGGEIQGSATVTVLLAGSQPNSCTAAAPPTECQARFLPTDPNAPPACTGSNVGECRLRWASRSSRPGFSFPKGRRNNTNAAPLDFTEVYCRAADYGSAANVDSAFPFTYDNADSNAGWCGFRDGNNGDVRRQTFVMSDPYSPGLNDSNPALPVGSTFPLNGTVQGVQYSIDGAGWSSTPPTARKTVGWSRVGNNPVLSIADSELGTSTGISPGVPLFIPFGGAADLQAYRDSILSLRMPSGWSPTYDGNPSAVTGQRRAPVSGLNTPLYGTLANAKDYLAEALDADTAAQCRPYAVLLITDGQENQATLHPQYPGQSAFTNYDSAPALGSVARALNDVEGTTTGRKPKDGKTKLYVVGFGASGGNLDTLAANGGTGTAFSVGSASALEGQLSLIFNALAESRYSRSKPVVVLDSGDGRLFAGGFELKANTREWFGSLDSYRLNDVGAIPTNIPARYQFAALLKAQSVGSRSLYARRLPGTSLVDIASWSGPERADFFGPLGVAGAGAADTLVDWMLNRNGGEPYNGLPLGTRSERLGDIYHSSPALVGPPRAPDQWPGSELTGEIDAYRAYKSANASRPSRLFVGSNDGMVHAICESTGGITTCPSGGTLGNEAYSYVPTGAFARLKGNLDAHTFTADGSFGGADMCLSGDCTDASNWKTYLFGSLHRGGQSVFGLDVSNPNRPEFLFDFNDDRLGYTWSPPTVARVNNVAVTSGPNARWIGLMGGGYVAPSVNTLPRQQGNSLVAIDLHSGAATGNARVVRDNVGTDASFRVDTNPIACETKPDTDADFAAVCPLKRNSVAARVSVARKGSSAIADGAFVGDTQGRVWSSDLNGSTVASWAPQRFFDPNLCPRDIFGVANAPIMGISVNAAGNIVETQVGALPLPAIDDPRPLFQRLTLARDGNDRVEVYGGTGDVLDPAFIGTATGNPKHYDYYYGLSAVPTGACQGTVKFVKRFPFGEKQLSEGTIGGPVVFVPVFIPPSGGDICNQRGSARIYAFYTATGQPALVFPPLSGPDNGTRTSSITYNGSGIISDLTFVANAGGQSGRIVGADGAGRPFSATADGLGAPPRIRNWRRVK